MNNFTPTRTTSLLHTAIAAGRLHALKSNRDIYNGDGEEARIYNCFACISVGRTHFVSEVLLETIAAINATPLFKREIKKATNALRLYVDAYNINVARRCSEDLDMTDELYDAMFESVKPLWETLKFTAIQGYMTDGFEYPEAVALSELAEVMVKADDHIYNESVTQLKGQCAPVAYIQRMHLGVPASLCKELHRLLVKECRPKQMKKHANVEFYTKNCNTAFENLIKALVSGEKFVNSYYEITEKWN
jgi:hypothetical protein